jgi:hypothetical protein
LTPMKSNQQQRLDSFEISRILSTLSPFNFPESDFL